MAVAANAARAIVLMFVLLDVTRSIDLFDDATFLRFDDVGAAIPVDVAVLPQGRCVAIDVLGEGLHFDVRRQALTPADFGAHGAAGGLPLALDGTRLGTCLGMLADHFAIAIAERHLALFGAG